MLTRLILAFALFLCFAAAGLSQALTTSVPNYIPPMLQGQAYDSQNQTASGSAVLQIFGGAVPYSGCAITAGALPAGISLSLVIPAVAPPASSTDVPGGLCVVSGTPSVNGDFTVTVQATDNASATSSKSATIIVEASSGLPVLSAVTATAGADGTQEVITWTTDIPSDSRVLYGLNYYELDTGASQTAGVTSHSVTLSGLVGSQFYSYTPISRAISGGSPKDYLTAYSSPLSPGSFQPTIPSAGSFDWSMQPAGPHNVIRGFPIYVAVYSGMITGSANYQGQSLQFQITGLCSFCQAHWPQRQDYGQSTGTVSTTTTTDDTFSGWDPIPTIQFEILTNVGGTTPVGSYTITFTGTTKITGGSAGPTHNFTWNINVAAASFPSGSPGSQPAIPLLSTWQTNMTAYGGPNPPYLNGWWYNGYQRNGITCEFGTDQQSIHYYDGDWVYDEIGTYQANLSFWRNGTVSPCSSTGGGAATSRYFYLLYLNRNVPPASGTEGFWVFPHGLFYDCVYAGASSSCSYLHSLASNANGAGLLANAIPYADALYTREGCYMLGAKRLDYDAGGGTTLAIVNAMAAYCLGDADQISSGAVTGNPVFQSGLIAHALLEYYLDPQTGNGDVRVPSAIKALADYLWANYWIPWAGNNGNFVYVPFWWPLANQPVNQIAVLLESLNQLISPMYAWLYLNTGLAKYQLEGDTIWRSGVNNPPACCGFGYTGKDFSQNYRWSILYTLWRGATTTNTGCYELPQIGTCPRIAVSGVSTRSTMLANGRE